MGKAKPKNWAVGRWLIESMTEWEREFIDEMVRGFFEFDTKDSGSFQFGCVEGQIDYRLAAVLHTLQKMTRLIEKQLIAIEAFPTLRVH